MSTIQIAPSILSADFARLGEEVNAVLQAGADKIHIDVMDHHYVPNLTFGPLVCKALINHGITAPMDVHLMVKPVDALIKEFAQAGATSITIHPEATEHLDRSLQLIKDQGCQAGVALNPASPLTPLKYILDKVDLILVMTVNPGFGGQKFMSSQLTKIQELTAMKKVHQHPLTIQVDGGVTVDNIAKIAKAGATSFVAGSAIFGSDDYKQTIDQMRKACC